MSNNLYLLLEDFSGENSALNAAIQYMQHSFIVEDELISKTLRRLAQEELQHYELLGEILARNGIQPKITNLRLNQTIEGCSGTSIEISQILKINLLSELETVMIYHKRISEIDIPSIQATLQRIVEEELSHINTLIMLMIKYYPDVDHLQWLIHEVSRKPLPDSLTKQIFNHSKYYY